MNVISAPGFAVVLSTLTFLWTLWRWRLDQPRVSARISAYENPWDAGIQFEIRNRGGKSTTVEEIFLVQFPERLIDRIRLCGDPECAEYVSAKYRKTAKLPVVLEPGGVWKGHAPFEKEDSGWRPLNKASLIESGRLFFKVRCSHSDRLLTGKVYPELSGL